MSILNRQQIQFTLNSKSLFASWSWSRRCVKRVLDFVVPVAQCLVDHGFELRGHTASSKYLVHWNIFNLVRIMGLLIFGFLVRVRILILALVTDILLIMFGTKINSHNTIPNVVATFFGLIIFLVMPYLVLVILNDNSCAESLADLRSNHRNFDVLFVA